MDTFRGIVGLGNFALMVVALLVLACFVYWVFLRKLIRARRIANLRLQRIMRERGSERVENK
jgi:peptidoglycan/LPS O-acetylase OafA/YrhL